MSTTPLYRQYWRFKPRELATETARCVSCDHIKIIHGPTGCEGTHSAFENGKDIAGCTCAAFRAPS